MNILLQQCRPRHNTAPLWQPVVLHLLPAAEFPSHTPLLRWHLGPELITVPAYYSTAKQRFAYNSSGKKKGAWGRKKKRKRKKKKTKAWKPSCEHVKLVYEYLICDHELQYMHRKHLMGQNVYRAAATFNKNTGPKALACAEMTGVCMCFVNGPGLIYLCSQHHQAR